jgi:ferredoxin
MAYVINHDDCIACGACEPECPVSCITSLDDGRRKIDPDVCVDCGACAEICPVDCISPK